MTRMKVSEMLKEALYLSFRLILFVSCLSLIILGGISVIILPIQLIIDALDNVILQIIVFIIYIFIIATTVIFAVSYVEENNISAPSWLNYIFIYGEDEQ